PSWSRTAASRTGCAYPWIAAHHEDMPSTSSRPSARRNRTPAAADTTSGRWVAGIGAYGCQTCSRSSAISSSGPMPRRYGTRPRPAVSALRLDDVHHPRDAELVLAGAELVAPHLLLERNVHLAGRREPVPVAA